VAEEDGFLSRWSRRKVQVKRGEAVPAQPEHEAATPTPVPTARAEAIAVAEPPAPAEAAAPPAPTLEEAQALKPDSDFRRFVGRDVDPQVKNTALKTLFSDPHFNIMDGLDTYIDDYGKPDPLPPGMLEQMTQTAFLGLFTKTPEEEAAAAAAKAESAATQPPPAATRTLPAPPEEAPCDEDTDLRLQPHHDAGCASAAAGAEQDPRRQP
jgi:hypothetical protein